MSKIGEHPAMPEFDEDEKEGRDENQVNDVFLEQGLKELLYSFRKNGGDLDFCAKEIMRDFTNANFKRVRPLEGQGGSE